MGVGKAADETKPGLDFLRLLSASALPLPAQQFQNRSPKRLRLAVDIRFVVLRTREIGLQDAAAEPSCGSIFALGVGKSLFSHTLRG